MGKSKWDIRHPITLRDIIGFALFIFVSYFAFVKKWDNSQLREDKIRGEERIKQYEVDFKLQRHYTDSVKESNTAMKAVIEYQKENPKIIEKKYETILNGVFNLPVDDKIKFLSGRVSKKNNN